MWWRVVSTIEVEEAACRSMHAVGVASARCDVAGWACLPEMGMHACERVWRGMSE